MGGHRESQAIADGTMCRLQPSKWGADDAGGQYFLCWAPSLEGGSVDGAPFNRRD